jgi:hypothetical protein
MDDPALLAETLDVLRDTGIFVFDIEMIRIATGFSPDRYKRICQPWRHENPG